MGEFKSCPVCQEQQARVDELQRRNRMLNYNIKEQGQKLVYQNKVIETQAEKLLGLRDEKAGLQNRINEALEDLEYPAAPWDETIASVVKVLRGDSA